MQGATANIVAGRFEEKERAEALVESLVRAGFPADRCTSFFVGPPGHHDRFPVGGDQDESPGAVEADHKALKGAGIGGAIGLGVGIAAAPVAGPAAVAAGVGVGAYVGSLAGALNGMGNKDEHGRMAARKSGFLVAVRADDVGDEDSAIRLLRAAGATEIERARGEWHAGRWADFDPTRPPALIAPAASSA
jgi:hypothetical protein